MLIIEIFAPGFVFFGFGVGALLVAVLLGLAPSLIPTVAIAVLVFAVASLIAWLVTRKLAGERKGQVKIWDTDINDD